MYFKLKRLSCEDKSTFLIKHKINATCTTQHLLSAAELVVWVVGKTLTSFVGHADSAQLSAGPPGPSSSSSYGPWSSGSGCRQTSIHPCLWLLTRPAWSPSSGCVCSLKERGLHFSKIRNQVIEFKNMPTLRGCGVWSLNVAYSYCKCCGVTTKFSLQCKDHNAILAPTMSTLYCYYCFALLLLKVTTAWNQLPAHILNEPKKQHACSNCHSASKCCKLHDEASCFLQNLRRSVQERAIYFLEWDKGK